MIDQRITLEVAAFLDSHAAAQLQLRREDIREIARRVLHAVFHDAGRAPQHLDGEEMQALLLEHLPKQFGRRDPLAAQVPAVLRAYLDDLEQREMVAHSYEVRAALDEHEDAFRAAVAGGAADPAATATPRPIVHRADKVGRNDPCPCGSGKKFKKCCAQLGA